MELLNNIFINADHWLRWFFGWVGFGGVLTDAAMALIYFIVIAAIITVNIIIILWIDRRFASFVQERLGPNRVGPFGLLQSMNDAVKLLGKELITPRAADKRIYKLAPILIFIVPIMAYAVLPYGKDMSPANINVGLLYFIAVSSSSTIAILMAGWGSNNKYSLLGSMRSVALIISYEIPLAFSTLGVVMLSGTLNLGGIVSAQSHVWYIVLQPLAFVIFLISAMAELNRAPFDMTEAEQELIGGYHTEYSGMRFALFFMAEYANLFSVAALGATLFLGGWQGPFLPSYIWFFGKVLVLMVVILWLRWTFPRLRLNKVMQFNWKFLIPVSIANLLVTGAGIKIYDYFTGMLR